MICIKVAGEPAPQGSKRHIGNGRMVESSTKVKPWRANVTHACIEANVAGQRLTGPLEIELMFHMVRPKSHYRTDGTLKDKAPFFSTVKPDIDKLVRSTFDALAVDAQVIADDAHISRLVAWKKYTTNGDLPGAVIWIRQLDETSAKQIDQYAPLGIRVAA